MVERRRKLLGVVVGLVALGLVQAGLGLRDGEPVYAGLGAAYAAIGVLFYVAER